jgi:hypothetical protein
MQKLQLRQSADFSRSRVDLVYGGNNLQSVNYMAKNLAIAATAMSKAD